MRDKPIIAVGMGAFIVLITFPIWYGLAAGANPTPPAVQLPTRQTKCVESKQWIVANHPRLLDDWRNAVVRHGLKEYTSRTYGTRYEMNLTNTCLDQCHGNRQDFCDRCHNYADVSLNCWNCHSDSTGNKP